MQYVEFLAWHRLVHRRSIQKRNASASAEYEQNKAKARQALRGG